MSDEASSFEEIISSIRDSGLSIYDLVDIADTKHWIPDHALETILTQKLAGVLLAGLPNRTRSKVAKQKVCEALGYPIPKSFKRTKPRFLGQNFDVYTQKANNLQVWNDEVDAFRRYAIIQISEMGLITKVKVISGTILAALDNTGTLTQKYQARYTPASEPAELVTPLDTFQLLRLIKTGFQPSPRLSPASGPQVNQIIPIRDIFKSLSSLIGKSFPDAGSDQERNRGGALHKLACQALGYKLYQDDGQFPDIRNQLVEVKLQTAQTIDLGLVTPSSAATLPLPSLNGLEIRHCDIRYAIFHGVIEGGMVRLARLSVTMGEGFFARFPQFQGKVINRKLQIPLPANFFDSKSKGLPD
jgi:hypothetical protein